MGLSRIGSANQQHTFQVTRAVGTVGYVDPQYMEKGILTKESDVYSFGVVLFEVLFGRLCYEISDGKLSNILVHKWKDCYKQKKLDKIVFQARKQLILDSLQAFSDISFQCLKRSCKKRPTMAHVVEKLEIALQFQVDHDLNLPREVIEFLRAAASPLACKSIEELKLPLSKGVLFNERKKWLSLSENGELCEMVAAADCVIPDRSGHNVSSDDYKSRLYRSRFVGPNLYESNSGIFKTHIRAQFLSPLVTYTVNLVFKFSQTDNTLSELRFIGLVYKLEHERRIQSSISYLAHERDDGWVMIELYEFTSDGSTIDLKIQFEGWGYVNYGPILIEGIEFRPLEKVEVEVLDDKNVDMQPISDVDLDWEQRLPNDYEEIVNWSEDGVRWTTKKELYYLLCKGFQINNFNEEPKIKWGLHHITNRAFNSNIDMKIHGHVRHRDVVRWGPHTIMKFPPWFFLAENGKKCYMLPAGAALIETQWSWQRLHESRFKWVAVDPVKKCFRIECNIKTRILSSQETYACYLVYKLLEDHFDLLAPLKVMDKDCENRWERTDYRFIFLVGSQTPVIGPKIDKNHSNDSLKRRKFKGSPRLRDNGWMEVQVWEFIIGIGREHIKMRVDLASSINIRLKGLIVQGVEFRPISS
ncbi:hypothetical protein QVD17_27290 [Tagetes erecta]|uniref:Protein kinase domain-containing protein n=1 Tax=Tagetes erecta TaxID=13708 RepID=A0AAD8KBL4_TARER|nr:hypothetical protein QVD17_27290 [Tagetes erecta]